MGRGTPDSSRATNGAERQQLIRGKQRGEGGREGGRGGEGTLSEGGTSLPAQYEPMTGSFYRCACVRACVRSFISFFSFLFFSFLFFSFLFWGAQLREQSSIPTCRKSFCMRGTPSMRNRTVNPATAPNPPRAITLLGGGGGGVRVSAQVDGKVDRKVGR